MFVLIVIITVVIGFVFLYMQLPVFGQKPKGERLERMEKSPNYRNEQFHNQNSTPMFVSKKGMFSVIMDKLFDEKPQGLRPKDIIPTIKT
ncbi:MAG: MBL fold metallo-hydrolase, partial [Bacteroidales bacterium]|nr:MBL fold metallo-hydrolase [Bacteroidales bacterium]